ncbi:hypothetical protein [Paenibacillus whitsoniae]|uniref:Uncharacterized protein n=1 Tax=Paenibacillus whitsoniae TaxID=2496558 RepID=A0A430JA05_9BACL|nr:hypothetical protein [Paenibacillus whitsoniae]RTE07883.1 hypothetical protein EJQ19_20440 [Paenibacillus whitsoniae]
MSTNPPDQDDFQQDLESGPLRREGFTPRLQHNIEDKIRRSERIKIKVKPLLVATGFGTFLLAAVLFPWSSLHTRSDAAALLNSPVPAEAMYSSLPAPVPISTALLIGLRTEHEPAVAGGTDGRPKGLRYSTYRTMLIAPIRGQLRKTSEGEGILMPYKQNFWKIDSLKQTTKMGEIRYLSTHMADQPAGPERPTADNAVGAGAGAATGTDAFNHVETLLFAGNQYLSIAESQNTWDGTAARQGDRLWVRTLPQLKENQGRVLPFAKKPAAADKNHVTLADLYGAGLGGELARIPRAMQGVPGEITGQSWAIQRESGRWVGKVAETLPVSAVSPDRYVVHDFPKELPDKVVNHDDLCCTWTDIHAAWPEATDALTSPMNDMLVVFEDGKLKFYPYGQAPGNAPQLTIDLQPGEQLVMAQWATDHYVQEWVDKVARYLPERPMAAGE